VSRWKGRAWKRGYTSCTAVRNNSSGLDALPIEAAVASDHDSRLRLHLRPPFSPHSHPRIHHSAFPPFHFSRDLPRDLPVRRNNTFRQTGSFIAHSALHRSCRPTRQLGRADTGGKRAQFSERQTGKEKRVRHLRKGYFGRAEGRTERQHSLILYARVIHRLYQPKGACQPWRERSAHCSAAHRSAVYQYTNLRRRWSSPALVRTCAVHVRALYRIVSHCIASHHIWLLWSQHSSCSQYKCGRINMSASDDSPSPIEESGIMVEAKADEQRASTGEKSTAEMKSPTQAPKSNSKDPSRPRRKKARRACFACQRAHLTCGK
jgi:hypothetical protein